MLKKSICLLLLSVMVLAVIVSCSEKGDNDTPGQTTQQNENPSDQTETTTSPYIDNLPDNLNFNGETIRFIVEEGSNGQLSERSIYYDETSVDVVDTAVYQRNLMVSERLNINIHLIETIMFSGLPAMIRTSVLAGSDDYDIVGTYQYYGIGLAAEGIVINLNDLWYNDFTQEYWAVQYMNNMSYKDARFWATGDLSLRYIGGMYVSYVNSRLWNSYFGDTDIYNYVYDGKWTLDALYTFAEQLYIDINGDSSPDDGDQFGFIINIQDPIEGVVAGSNIKFSEIADDGTPYIILDNERTTRFYEKAYSLLYENTGSFITTADDSVASMNMFNRGNTLATINKLYQSEVYLRDMEDDFYIIPVPKFDEEQEHYNTTLHDGVTLFGVPLTNNKLEATSATLEALAAESYRLIAPAYYETALKVKYARDSESAQMIDLVRENVSADFVFLYSNSINNIAHIFRTMLSAKAQNTAAHFSRYEKLWDTALDTLLTNLEENADNY